MKYSGGNLDLSGCDCMTLCFASLTCSCRISLVFLGKSKRPNKSSMEY